MEQQSPPAFNPQIYDASLRANGVMTFDSASGRSHQIPAAFTPTTVDGAEWNALVSDARSVITAMPKLLSWLQRDSNKNLFNLVFKGLTGIELDAARIPPEQGWGHAAIRLDLFWHSGAIKIIEINCTIPAMQSYSDRILASWKNAGGIGESPYSNESQLLEALFALYRANGGKSARPAIVILHRDGDSQIAELRNLRSRWEAIGHHVTLATPDQLQKSSDLWQVGENYYEIVYRHIFAWRLPEDPWSTIMANSKSSHIYNPVSAHYECKSFLALLSQVADSPQSRAEVGLSADEVAAVRSRVPWSRLLIRDHQPLNTDEWKTNLQRLVIKRSVGYGGHSVILGQTWHSDDTQQKLRHLLATSGAVSLEQFLSWATLRDSSPWIAQEMMTGARRRTDVLVNGSIQNWNAWYDASLFVSSGNYSDTCGGVSRIANNQIVNIGTGGGLAPFVITGS